MTRIKKTSGKVAATLFALLALMMTSRSSGFTLLNSKHASARSTHIRNVLPSIAQQQPLQKASLHYRHGGGDYYSKMHASCVALRMTSSIRNSGDHYDPGKYFDNNDDSQNNNNNNITALEEKFNARLEQLEQITARQELEIQRLRKECDDLTDAAVAFARVVELLRTAGLQEPKSTESEPESSPNTGYGTQKDRRIEHFEDAEIFGTAPASVIDAADAAGASILAGMLGGKQRMLVDVRDAELADGETLVQFVELAILPVAAGMEGLRSTRNRVKIVFPTVSQLLQYRRSMALAAPEVVALSTLGFDPVEPQDQLVVILAPSPDDEEGLKAMNELLEPSSELTPPLHQPIVVINHHMLPVSGPAKDFEVAYHLRLLSVQYTSNIINEDDDAMSSAAAALNATSSADDAEKSILEAAMKHAKEAGMRHGTTRAMVTRAFPK